MTKHRASVVVGLVTSVFLERAAFYGTRSVLSTWMAFDLGMDDMEALEAFTGMVAALAFAPLLGGVLALAVGPRVTLALGAVFAALGCGALAVTDAGPPILGLSLGVVGGGLFKPAWMIALARESVRADDNQRTAIFLMAFVGIDVAAMVATFGAPILAQGAGASMVFGVSAGVLAMVAVLTSAVAIVRKQVGEGAEAMGHGFRAEAGAGLLLLLLVPSYLGASAVDALLPAGAASAPFGASRLLAIWAPISSIAVTAIAMVVFFVAARKGAQPLALPVIGGGLVVTALATGAGAFAGVESGLSALLFAGGILTAMGQAVVLCVALPRVAADTRPRTATLVLAIFLVAPAGLGYLVPLAEHLAVTRIVAGVGAAFTLVAGMGLLAFASRMQQRFYGSPANAPAPPGPPGADGLQEPSKNVQS